MNKKYVYFIGTIAALAGLLFGIDIGVVAGIQPYLKSEWGLTTSQIELSISSILIGAVLGAIISGPLNRIFGRKPLLAFSALIFVIGSLGSAFAGNYETLIYVRIFLGLALGIATFTAPLYLSEIAPKEIRGMMVSTYQLMITIGIVVAYISDLYFVHLNNINIISDAAAWRWMLGVVAIPSAFMLFIVIYIPRSPRWVAIKGNNAEALKILKKLYCTDTADKEMKVISQTVNNSGKISTLLKNKKFIGVLILGIALQLIQQFSGMNAILYYAPTMFTSAGFNHTGAMQITILIGIVNVLSTLVAVKFIDIIGRKKLLQIGSCILIISTLFLAILFNNHMETYQAVIAIILIFLFIFGFAISYGPVIWTLCAEIFPIQGRELGITCSTAANWIGNTLVASYSLTIMHSIGTNMFYLMLMCFAIISFFVFKYLIPETNGITLEEIEQQFWEEPKHMETV
jgi:MFS transporter, SP family, galactose:H+ symporter